MGKTNSAKHISALRLMDPASTHIRGHLVGTLLGWDELGPVITYPHNPHGPLPARSTVPIPRCDHSNPRRVPVLLVFEEERSDRPIIVGMLAQTSPAPASRAAASEAAAPAEGEAMEALVDGRRVVLDAQDEVVLRCGRASITLRRNGRVVIRGTYVETRSEGVNRIKGGSVQIN